MSLSFNRLDKIKVLISPETWRANFCFSRCSKELRSALSRILTFFFFPRAILPFVVFFFLLPSSSESSTFIGLIMQMLKYQQGSNLSGSALFSGLLEAARGHRALPRPRPPAQTGHCARHADEICTHVSLDYTCQLWEPGPPRPPPPLFPGPRTFLHSPTPTSPGASLAREPAWHQPPQIPTWRRCAKGPILCRDSCDGRLNPHPEDAEGQQTRRRISSEIETQQNILISSP